MKVNGAVIPSSGARDVDGATHILSLGPNGMYHPGHPMHKTWIAMSSHTQFCSPVALHSSRGTVDAVKCTRSASDEILGWRPLSWGFTFI